MLNVVGIRPGPGSIEPAGIHLRWAFASELGFPAGAFSLYRRDAKAKTLDTAPLDRVTLNTPVSAGADLNGVRFAFPAGGSLLGGGQNGLQTSPRAPSLRVELRFAEPVARVSLQITNPGALVVRAFAGDRLMVQAAVAAAAGLVSVDLEWPGLTVIEVPLDFDRLRQLSFSTVTRVCRGDDLAWGVPRMTLNPLANATEAAARFELGLRNRYAATVQDAVARYQAGAGALIDWLTQLRTPASPPFDEAGVPPHRLTFAEQPQQTLSRLRPLPVLLAAALDPNVARLLGLYWVDRDGIAGGPSPGTAYDYKVEAAWGTETHCGLALRIGAQPAERPVVRGPVVARQARGFDWAGRVPRARVALRWARPASAGLGSPSPIKAMLYDVARVEVGTGGTGPIARPLTADAPVMVPSQSWQLPDASMFREANLPLGKVRYSVTAIDLFGQTGPGLDSNDLELVDRDGPPPPVRVRAELEPGGRSAIVDLEYGYLERQQAPDAKVARCYARADTLVESRAVRVDPIDATREPDGRWRHGLRVREPNGAALPAGALELAGDRRYHVLRITHDAARRRGIDRRRRFPIDRVGAGGRVEVLTREPLIEAGRGTLVSDPKARHLWQRRGSDVKLENPVRAKYDTNAATLTAKVVAARDLGERVSPLAQLPPDRRPPDARAGAAREILLDLALLDADIFKGGTAQVGGQTEAVLYQTAGGQKGEERACVAVPPTLPVAPGQTITLTLSPDQMPRYRVVELVGTWPARTPLDRFGEAAFLMKEGAGPLGARIGRIASGIVIAAGHISLLVDASEPVEWWDTLPQGTGCELSFPYRIEVAISSGSLDLTAAPGAPTRSAFFAVSAEDDRANEGTLSLPVIVVAVRQAPQGAPSAPYACAGTAADAEGFATLPDARGNATLCLKWDVGSVAAADGLTWEVARALDATIVAVHRREWSAGRADAAPATMGAVTAGTVSQITAGPPGLFRARLRTPGAAPPVGTIKGARFKQGARCWTVTSAAAVDAKTLELLVRPEAPGGAAPGAGSVSLEHIPDYTGVLDSDASLRARAASLPDAFAVVTGATVAAREYRDQMPGTGRNRFFYRVRAVDAAQQRSAWSPVSAPMRLVDSTAPDSPTVFQAMGGERRATLRWYRDTDSRVVRYRVHRARSAADLSAPFGLTVFAEVGAGTGAEVVWIDEPLEGTLGAERYFYRVTAVKQVRRGLAAGDVLEIASLPSETVGGSVVDTSLPPPAIWVGAAWEEAPGVPPAVRLEWQSTGVAFVFERNDRRGPLWQRVELSVTAAADGWVARDTTAEPTRAYGYRVAAVNRFGRQSAERPAIVISALR